MSEGFSEDLLKIFIAANAVNIFDSGVKSLFDSKESRLNRTEKSLAIIQKKKQLGLPISDDDYEYATNNDKSYTAQAVGATGRTVMQRIPNPQSLATPGKAYTGIAKDKLFQIAGRITSAVPSYTSGVKQSIKLGGGRYGTAAAVGASVLGKLWK